jgi:HlyD family secretion protein
MRRPSRPLVLVVVIGVIGAIAWFGFLRPRGKAGELTASGTVEATESQLGFQVPGRIEVIAAVEGERVAAGTELARLDRTEAEARRSQAAAQAAAARSLLDELEGGSRSEEVAQGRAARDAALQRLDDARRDLDRTKKLLEGGAVSQEAFDKASLAASIAESQLSQTRDQLRLLEIGPRKERIEAQRAQVAQAEAAIQVIDATLVNMTIRAPFDGIVTVRHREPGEIVPAGSAVLTLMNPDSRWVRIYVSETRIGAVRLGQKAQIRTDTDPGKRYGGEVVFIASEAEFTPKTVQTSEERVKLVYAVKVGITDDSGHDLKPGMPADVVLDSGKP